MSHPHPLTWLYRKLGRRYPSVFITVELQTAFLVATGAVALFSFYYSVSSDDFLTILAITLGLTAIGIGFVLVRVLKRLRPLNAWIAGDRVRRADRGGLAPGRGPADSRWSGGTSGSRFVVTLITVVAAVAILELSWLCLLPDPDRGAARHRATPARCTTWRSSWRCGRSSSTSTRRSTDLCGSTGRRCRCG